MSHVEDMAPDEISQRTAIAVDAQHEAYKAQMGVLGLKRRVSRIAWVWNSLGIIAVIFAAGYIAREQVGHYATKEALAASKQDIEQLQKWKEHKDEHERMLDETITRMARQLDGLYDHLMREKHR